MNCYSFDGICDLKPFRRHSYFVICFRYPRPLFYCFASHPKSSRHYYKRSPNLKEAVYFSSMRHALATIKDLREEHKFIGMSLGLCIRTHENRVVFRPDHVQRQAGFYGYRLKLVDPAPALVQG